MQLHRRCPMSMRWTGIAVMVALTTGTVAAQTQNPDPPDGKTYLQRTFSAGAIGSAGVGAAVSQGTDTPGEWGQGAGGFAERLGSAMGKHLVKRAIQYPVSKFFHEELNY